MSATDANTMKTTTVMLPAFHFVVIKLMYQTLRLNFILVHCLLTLRVIGLEAITMIILMLTLNLKTISEAVPHS